jgi:predicted acylesterase/phospholipase RssA
MTRALVLAAGGVTGALYEVGVVRAMEERHGSLLDRFDLFVGILAGASVAAFLAQGVSPTRFHPGEARRQQSRTPLRGAGLRVGRCNPPNGSESVLKGAGGAARLCMARISDLPLWLRAVLTVYRWRRIDPVPLARPTKPLPRAACAGDDSWPYPARRRAV